MSSARNEEAGGERVEVCLRRLCHRRLLLLSLQFYLVYVQNGFQRRTWILAKKEAEIVK
jgi:hypothetical protein